MKLTNNHKPGDSEHEFANEERPEANGSDERVIELERQLAETRDQLLRRTADVDNMRRRHKDEREQLIYESNKRLITDLLPTLDDLERTLQHGGADKDALLQGLELINKNLGKVLQRYGLEPMGTEGQPFDVSSHDALLEEARSDVQPGTVVKEIQKGYKLNDNVLRHAKVIVAKEKGKAE
jgi:molecular chaperone GrpE